MEKGIESFGTVIKAIRKERRLTQKMLSHDICAQSVLSRIENDEELPNVVVMGQLCKRLGVTIDQVMALSSRSVRGTVKLFEKMSSYLRQKKYHELEELLLRSETIEQLFLDTDFQKYYYYLGSCEFYLYNNLTQSIKYLKQGLSYTFHFEKMRVSDTEIQLLSCIGKVYGDAGQITKAKKYLSRSVLLFNELPDERINAELTKIFFNYGSFLYSEGELEAAMRQINQGIDWAKNKNSYYYLDELFQLKANILKKQNFSERAALFEQAAENIRAIATFS